MKMFTALLSILSANFLYFILHINNTSSFPKPLSPKEEAATIVSHIVKKYYSKTNDTDDLISIGTIGLIKAIDSFNPDKGIKLATYASRCIENEILMHFRNIRKNANDVYLGDSLEMDKDGNPLTIQETISDSMDLAEDLETKIKWEKVSKLIQNMDDEREKEIIILRYGLDNRKPLTQREVAERLKISRSYVSRIEKKVLNEIKDKVEKNK